MPGLLPLAALLLLATALRCRRGPEEPTLREDLLAAALILGFAVGLGTELLGAFGGIGIPGMLGFWAAATIAAGALLAGRWRRAGPPPPLRFSRPGAGDGFLLAGIVAVALAVFVVAWLAPPQSSDSLGYHMSRVMHWIQDRSLAPYPTDDTRQLYAPPFAEMVRLHLQLLTGGDRAGGLLQWLAAAGALLAATLIARDLGGGRRAQILTALVAVTIPIGITQASSGKNGWVETLWLLTFAHFSGAVSPGGLASRRRRDVVAASIALGLEAMTRLTAGLFAFPLLLAAVVRTRRSDLRRMAAPVAAGGLLFAALTSPFLLRNLRVFGNPLDDPVLQASVAIPGGKLRAAVSNAIRNCAYQFGTTSPAINRAILAGVVRVHRGLGLDPYDPDTSARSFAIDPWTTVEEFAGSPIPIALLLAAGVVLAFRPDGRARRLLASILAGYVLFCATVRWQPPNNRLLMPLLVLASPLLGVLASEILGRGAPALAAALVAAAVPFVFGVDSRPLSFEPGRGVLATPRRSLYFTRVPGMRAACEEVARSVRSAGVRNLGVVFAGSGRPEYPLWVVLKDGGPPVRIEHVAVTNASAAFESRPPYAGFRPELVVAFAPESPGWRFDPSVSAAGAEYRLVRTSGAAACYRPVTERRSP